jgi:hypothetical protein
MRAVSISLEKQEQMGENVWLDQNGWWEDSKASRTKL